LKKAGVILLGYIGLFFTAFVYFITIKGIISLFNQY